MLFRTLIERFNRAFRLTPPAQIDDKLLKAEMPAFIEELRVWLPTRELETLDWLLKNRAIQPESPIALLDLVDKQSINEGVADGRCGYVGNPHEERVISIERLYSILDSHFQFPQETFRTRCMQGLQGTSSASF